MIVPSQKTRTKGERERGAEQSRDNRTRMSSGEYPLVKQQQQQQQKIGKESVAADDNSADERPRAR